MFGPPKDVEGQCNCRFEIADDEGDNHATMRCQLPPGHEGEHEERWGYMSAGQVFEAVCRWPAGNSDVDQGPRSPSPCEGCPNLDTCEGCDTCEKVVD